MIKLKVYLTQSRSLSNRDGKVQLAGCLIDGRNRWDGRVDGISIRTIMEHGTYI